MEPSPAAHRFRIAAALLALGALGILGILAFLYLREPERTAHPPRFRPAASPERSAPTPQPRRVLWVIDLAEPGAPHPAGMVLFPGGRARIGIDPEALRELIRTTSLGRMKVPESAIDAELGPSAPGHEVDLPPFGIGKYPVTNAQYDHFLRTRARVVYTVPPAGKPGARTLEEISRMILLTEPFVNTEGKTTYLPTVEWYQLYDINEETLNPSRGPDGRAVDPRSRLPREKWRSLALPEGVKVVTFRHTLPKTWKTPVPDNRYQEHYLPGAGDHPVTGVSLIDARAFARTYACHIPHEYEWEAAARGPGGSLWPEGPAFDPLGHAWRGFDDALREAREDPPEEPARRAFAATAPFLDPDFRGDVLTGPVGSFPLGTSPIGAMDMIGLVVEWTSDRLFPYPGTKRRSPWFGHAWSLRGGNLLDMDTILQATFRKFLHRGFPLESHFRSYSAGFRVARHGMPGASAALPAVQALVKGDVGILPGEFDSRTFRRDFTGLDIHAAAGVDQVDEVAWNPSGSPGNDPPGKVFHLGPTRGVAVVPADGTPFRDLDRLRAAADAAALPAERERDRREPRGVPFLGLLHIHGDLAVRASTTLGASDHPGGLLLGWVRSDEELRPALWEARRGVVGTPEPGGLVLLEPPLAFLEPGDLTLRRVHAAGKPASDLDPVTGRVTLRFFVPVEPRDRSPGAWEATLRLRLEGLDRGPPDAPWRVLRSAGVR